MKMSVFTPGRIGLALLALSLAACGSSSPVAGEGDEADGGTPPVETPGDDGPLPGNGGPYISAHRGGSAYAPENTMMAYRNAARLYVDDFETDAWLTADGVAVLMHDPSLERTTDCTGDIADHTLAELADCDAGYWYSPGQDTTSPSEFRDHPARGKGVRIPTAQELFDFAASFQGDYRPTVTIEIKNFGEAFQTADVLVPMIQASGIKDRIVVQSFNPLGLNYVKRLDPEIRVLYLTPSALGATAGLTYASLSNFEFVSPQSTSGDLNASFVSTAHTLGKQVVPWTPDTLDELQAFTDMGVDGIITNYPGCMLAMQGRLVIYQLTPPELGPLDVALCKQ